MFSKRLLLDLPQKNRHILNQGAFDATRFQAVSPFANQIPHLQRPSLKALMQGQHRLLLAVASRR